MNLRSKRHPSWIFPFRIETTLRATQSALKENSEGMGLVLGIFANGLAPFVET